MAAKPPKPPGNFLNNISPNNSSEKNNNKLSNHNNDKSIKPKNTNNSSNNNLNCSNTNNNEHTSDGDALDTSTKPTCNCSNISIMHLFHEMKQEFPTIPDQIVTQCVNENCHDRENCTSMLRNELALNPIPVQAYPSKVLQRQQHQQKLELQQQLQQLHQQHQQQKLHQQQQHHQEKPNTPLKPTRVAPPPVSVSPANLNLNRAPTVSNSNCKISSHLGNFENCESVCLNNSLQSSKILDKKDVEKISENLSEVCMVDKTAKTKSYASDMPTLTKFTTPTTVELNNFLQADSAHQISTTEQQHQQIQQQPQRARPTTLNLNPSQPQQQLRHQLNVQLQQHLQHRNQPTKPVRKAPLPPLPPKPALISNTYTSPASRTPQYSSNTSLSSPISSGGESEISVNVGSLSSPTTATSTAHQQHQHNQLKSPIRHRSVINVQPEPPYTRDFLVSPSSSSAGSSNQKSFTTVNLTLRQPNASAAQSTIDISAGPGLSSAGGTGLTYSSTSYDARRGCQKKFHITVTDEGGVFSASRIKPRSCYNPAGEQECDGSGSAGGVGLHSPASEQTSPYLNQHQQRIVANFNNSGEMCLPRVTNGFNEILQRQRARRDKLSTALRDNKKRLSQVEEEINVLTDPICPGESERLDSEIQRLRCDCESMLNEIENSKRCDPNIENSQGLNSINSRQQPSPQQAHPPQPFPRQRPPRPPPPGSLMRQPMDFVQHHVVSSTPPMNSPSNQLPPTYQQLQQQYQQQMLQQQQILQQQQQPLQPSTDDEDYSDSNTDGGDEDEGGLETWACNMCTFRNHPQLNICECCENVRILPESVLSREDIHITLSPGENRIVHSWIVS